MPPDANTLSYRIEQLEKRAAETDKRAGRAMEVAAKHEEQINGHRGLSASIDGLGKTMREGDEAIRDELSKTEKELMEEIRSLRRTLWMVGAGIVASSVGFAFTVLAAT